MTYNNCKKGEVLNKWICNNCPDKEQESDYNANAEGYGNRPCDT